MSVIDGLELRLAGEMSSPSSSSRNGHKTRTRNCCVCVSRQELNGSETRATISMPRYECMATTRLRPHLTNNETSETTIDHTEHLISSSVISARHVPCKARTNVIRMTESAAKFSIDHHHHRNYHRHHHHLKPTHHKQRWHHSKTNSIEPPSACAGLPNMRASSIGPPMARSMIYRTFLMLVIIFSMSPQSISSGLDSPVKVQRNKQQQLLQQQQPTNASWPLSSEPSAAQANGETALAGSPSKIDRVRRTNGGNEQQATRTSHNQRASQQQQQQRDCPSNRLIQGLLPPEYAGSPATSQRPSMARAHCECVADPLGWHLTCFAGSLGASGGGGQSPGRTSGGSTAPPMPNQLHPAFRSSQMARQQQQQAAGRRHKRSSSDAADHQSAPGSHEPSDEASTHEGFGEDPAATSHHHQNQGGPSAKPPAYQKQRDARPQQGQQQQQQRRQQQQNRQETANYITSFSSNQDEQQDAGQVRDGTRTGPNQNQNQDQAQQRRHLTRETPETASQDRLVPAASSVYSQHLTFQPVPVLFGVKYLRNNMIEIDCDQSVPNYKAAMFRGFNVNEISSFTFNNCQLPNIPFSALLHRTRTTPDQQHMQQAPGGGGDDEIAPGANQGNHHQPQALKPNRRQQFGGAGSFQRRKRQAGQDDDEPEAGEARSAERNHQRPHQSAGQGPPPASGEPKVKSLTINLNAIVDQRTLITLLTGLDLLEELQLNYMQLNLTNFINDLQQTPSTPPTTTLAPSSSPSGSMAASTPAPSLTTTSTTTTTTATASAGPNSSSGSGASLWSSTNPSSGGADELTLAASANVDFGSPSSARVATSNQMASPPSSVTSPQLTSRLSSPMTSTTIVIPSSASTPASSSTTTTSTTTSTTTTTTTTTTTPSPASATTTMSPNMLKPFRRQPIGTTFSTGASPTTTPTTSNHRLSSTATGPSIGLGAPRGLVIAQATGMPPPMTTIVASTTPLSTNSANSYQTTGSGSGGNSVPSVPLSTVHASMSSSSSSSIGSDQPTTTSNRAGSQAGQQQAQANNATTTMAGPGQRHSQDGTHLISVGLGQSQSVSYTALGPAATSTGQTQANTPRTTRPQSGMFHLAPATTTTTISTSLSSQSPGGSTLMSSSPSSSSSTAAATQTSATGNPNRLHQSPSGWTASSSRSSSHSPAQMTTTTGHSQLAAGSRLSMSTGQSSSSSSSSSSASPSSDLLISATSSALPPSSTAPSSSQVLSWSAMGASPATAALTTPANSLAGLSAPANTPSFTGATSGQGPMTTTTSATSSSFGSNSNSVGSNYGFRTGGSSSASVPTTNNNNNNQNMRTITTVQQSRRQPTTTTIIATNTSPQQDQGGFVAAGVRLHQQQAAGGLGNQRRFRPQQQQPGQSGGASTTSRFASSFSSSSSSGASPIAVTDDQFVSHQDAPSHDHGARSPTLIASFNSGHRRNQHNNNNNHLNDDEANNGDEDEDSLDPNTSTTPNLERISRATRSKRAAGPSMEEFELSFGDLLPSLRTLKLESFIDLSPLVASSQVAPPASSPASSSSSGRNQPSRKRTGGQSGVSLMRFKRQFKPEDAPEHEASEMGETLLAEESSLERNSVAVTSRHLSPDDASDRDDNQPDVEPGETLWRSASGRSSASLASDDHDDPDSDSPHVSIAAAPPSMAQSNSQASFRDGSEHNNDPTELSGSESQLHQRQRQFSAFVLGRLFSRLNRLQVLHLTSNEIPYWPDNVLQDSRNSLIRLYLISNNMRQLGARSFAGLVALRSLDLSSNQLRQLDGDLLRDLVELRQFRACRNLFRRLPLKLLMRQQSTGSGGNSNDQSPSGSAKQTALAKLDSVDFSKNKYLTEFQLDHHHTTSQQLHPLSLAPITSLNLSDCSLGDQLLTASAGAANQNNNQQQSQNSSSTNQMFFAALGELASISLRNNKFRDLLNVANLFGKNRQLKSLDLSHNQLERLNGHLFNANASQIQELRLNHNKLAELPDQLLFNLRKLRHLSLGHNRLAQLNSKMFLTNQLLESLDLSYNQITTLNTHSSGQIPFGNGANLKRLSLAHNNLSAFEQDVFDVAWSFYTQLQWLDLSHNKFSGQIQMPIFYTITDEMALNLGSNRIQSVSVDALVQHEQVLDRFATSFEALASNGDDPELGDGGGPGAAKPNRLHHSNEHQPAGGGAASSRGPPTVSIRLANNPLACDCMLEPLVSYTRRVAAASNPALVASLFQQQHHQQQPGQSAASLSPGSKYSYSAANNQAPQDQSVANKQQPQVLYQFKFSDLHCDRPRNLQRRLLSHISIGDLLCPIQDERLCPRQCECHYQSAFKTVIVDCNGRQLTRVPDQLGDASNFNQFEVLTSFNLSTTSSSHSPTNNRLTITHVDKMIIRLDNNQLDSIDELAHLFQVVALQKQQQPAGDQQHQSGANLRFARSSPFDDDERHFPLGSPENQSPPSGSGKKKISPVAMARLQQLQQQRQTREASAQSSPMGSRPQLAAASTEETPVAMANSNNYLDESGNPNSEHHLNHEASGAAATSSSSLGADFDSLHHRDASGSGGATQPALPPMSTAVLESAEEFRTGRYSHKTCELYLDHNNIEALPDSFLAALDQIRSSSLQASSSPPQAALPTAMLEPPIHTKLNTLNVAAESAAGTTSGADPMRTSASSLYGAISAEEPPVSSLFGRQPFAAEKKAALIESVQQSVRMNKLQQQQQDQQQEQNNKNTNKFTVSPSLVVLSLRYNNLANLRAKTLSRLSKLIKSSGTRLYLGHNPFNCSENFALDSSYDNATSFQSLGDHPDNGGGLDEGLVASPMGDQLLASSDSVSGAYLEPSPDDLTPSASGENSANSFASNSIETGHGAKVSSDNSPLTPTDCPVGQLKTWLTRHHSHVGDLDELYCVHMPTELADKLKLMGASTSLAGNSTGSGLQLEGADLTNETSERHKARRQVGPMSSSNGEGRREHDHPWTSSLNSPALTGNGGSASGIGAGDQPTVRFVNTSQLHKNGVTWNADLLMVSAKLIDLDLYDLCPYSNIQLLDSASLGYLSAGHQRALISVAIVFIIISLLLLVMLIYFGDTQTILAFVYIHMNPIYNCLHLNESHLDGEKLYDAFVSYSSADRDIVMELIEHLEQPGAQFDGQRLLSDGKGTNLDRSRDVLVTEEDLRPDLIPTAASQQQDLGTLQRRSTSTMSNSSASFQDLSTMSRSTSRMMLDAGDYSTTANSQLDISSSPALRNEQNNNINMQLNATSTDKIMASQQQLHQLNTNRPYRLCIHERDWLPGHLISWNIVNSVQNSRRTILILSKEFIKSVWFQVEFHTAYYQMLEDKIDRLIVIVRGELPPKHELDKNLAFLLTTKTYLTWGEKWFWERLHYALPHRAGPPPPLAVSHHAAKAKQQQPRLKKQQAPVGQNNRDRPLGGGNIPQSAKLSGSAAGLLSSLAAGHADPPRQQHQQQQQQQQALLMSSIGKDCSRLLLNNSPPTAGNRNNSSSSSAASSGSSGSSNTLAAGQAGGARSASASSFLSGSSSTNQLFKQDTDHQQNQMMTTSNDLLSSPISPIPNGGNNTTRLSIGGGGPLGMRSSSPLQPATASTASLGHSLMSEGQSRPTATTTTTTSGGITSIMLDGSQTGSAGALGPNSRARSKKQEKLQSFVEKEISSRFNLSEL